MPNSPTEDEFGKVEKHRIGRDVCTPIYDMNRKNQVGRDLRTKKKLKAEKSGFEQNLCLFTLVV